MAAKGKRGVGGAPPFAAPPGTVWIRKGKDRWQLQTVYGKLTQKLRQDLAHQDLERQGLIAATKGRPGSGIYAAPEYAPSTDTGLPGTSSLPVAPTVSPAPVLTQAPVTLYPAAAPAPYQVLTPGVYADTVDYGDSQYEDYEDFFEDPVYSVSERYGAAYEDEPFASSEVDDEWGLEGIFDYFSWSYWKGKWDEMVATLQARVGRLMGNKAELLRRRRRIDAALKARPNHPPLREALARNQRLMSDQVALEREFIKLGERVSTLKPSVQQVEEADEDQLGLIPVAVWLLGSAGALAAVLALAATAFYKESNHARELDLDEQKLDAVLAEKLPPSVIEQPQPTGGTPPGGGGILGDLAEMMKGATGLLVAGAGLWALSKWKRV